MKYFVIAAGILLFLGSALSEEIDKGPAVTEQDLGASREGSRTDAEVVSREEEAISPDGLSVAQLKELQAKAKGHEFQAEVTRMMKLIINSLYRNKEIFLRELISNASDAIDKIRLLALTNPDILQRFPELSIKIKAEPEARRLHIIDTGIGMTKDELVKNLGTIAKSGTADFLARAQSDQGNTQEMNDMIGQFGVGFYSAFLVAENVTVVSKHDNDSQHVWHSDASAFSVMRDPRGDTLQRGTHITLHLKEEASDYLQQDTIRNLIKKYSQFINFPIYLWGSKTETVEVEESEEPAKADGADDEDAQVEDAAEEKPTKKKSTEKTVWQWELMNDNKPIWTRKASEVSKEEYEAFYKSLTRDTAAPLAYTHFEAEGEVSFRALVFVPRVQPSDSFNRYGTVTDNIKLFVRRVFITDEMADFVPKYLAFLQGLVDSDDLPLNVSRETLQQHKLLKVIKKKLVRKALDMLLNMSPDDYKDFWKQYSTNIKLGLMEDPSNRSRLSKLLRFDSSQNAGMVSLADYVARMKPGQDHIYYIAGPGRAEVESSPFAEKLIKKGYEVLYLTEAVDEYALSGLTEFDGKKFQNAAKEILDVPQTEDEKESFEQQKKQMEPLTSWLSSKLGALISRAQVSRRLARSPAALVASVFGWTGNMERLAMSNAHQKADDPQRKHHLSQKKIMEINPKHPLVLELLRRVQEPGAADAEDTAALAGTLYRAAALRSGYMLQEGQALELAREVEAMLMGRLGLAADALDALDDDESTPAADADADADADERDEL